MKKAELRTCTAQMCGGIACDICVIVYTSAGDVYGCSNLAAQNRDLELAGITFKNDECKVIPDEAQKKILDVIVNNVCQQVNCNAEQRETVIEQLKKYQHNRALKQLNTMLEHLEISYMKNFSLSRKLKTIQTKEIILRSWVRPPFP